MSLRPRVSQKYIPRPRAGELVSATSPRGYPFRQGAMPLKLQELDDLRYSADFGCRAFDLGKPEDAEEYTRVMDLIFNKRYRLVGPVPQPFWDPAAGGQGTWRVFVQWLDVKAEVPPYVLKLMGWRG